MIVTTLADNLTVSVDSQTSSVDLNIPKTTRGIVQFKTGTFTGSANRMIFTLQGRLHEEMEWVDITGATKIHGASGVTTAAEDITLYPQMRCDLNITAFGGGTVPVTIQVGG